MSTNPYQPPAETSVSKADSGVDESAQEHKTLRLWILPTGLAGIMSGFAFSLFLLSSFESLRDKPSTVIGCCVVTVGLAYLWVGDRLFESSSKR
jgi:hypothetical protein